MRTLNIINGDLARDITGVLLLTGSAEFCVRQHNPQTGYLEPAADPKVRDSVKTPLSPEGFLKSRIVHPDTGEITAIDISQSYAWLKDSFAELDAISLPRSVTTNKLGRSRRWFGATETFVNGQQAIRITVAYSQINDGAKIRQLLINLGSARLTSDDPL